MAITKTYVKPLQGQSPIILHNVPQSITVGDITGDKGTNEVWADTKGIEDFTATITTLDEYSTGVPYKKITVTKEFDVEEKTWGEGEESTEEAEEKTFTLNYKGHERDFEIKVVEGEGGEGSGEPQYIIFEDEDLTFYLLEIEEPPEDAVTANCINDFGSLQEVVIGSADDILAMLEVDPSDLPSLKNNTYYGMTAQSNWAETCIFYDGSGDDGIPLEDEDGNYKYVVPVTSSGSSPKLRIRYRWGMNDSHDLSVEKDITITERPTPVEPEEGGEDLDDGKYFGSYEVGDTSYYCYAIRKGLFNEEGNLGVRRSGSSTTWNIADSCKGCPGWSENGCSDAPPEFNDFLLNGNSENYIGICYPNYLPPIWGEDDDYNETFRIERVAGLTSVYAGYGAEIYKIAPPPAEAWDDFNKCYYLDYDDSNYYAEIVSNSKIFDDIEVDLEEGYYFVLRDGSNMPPLPIHYSNSDKVVEFI